MLQYVSWCQGQHLPSKGLSILSRSLAPLVVGPRSSELVPAAQGPSNLGSSDDWIGQGPTLAHPRFHLCIIPASIQHRRLRSSVINAHSQASSLRVASSNLAHLFAVVCLPLILEPIERASEPSFCLSNITITSRGPDTVPLIAASSVGGRHGCHQEEDCYPR